MNKAVDNVTFSDLHPAHGNVREEIMQGLTQPQKTVDPKYFYDERGSVLFDQITALPEYYPTRTEINILHQHSLDIAAQCGSDCILIEPGSGSSAKVRILLEDLQPSAYIPIDISAAFLEASAREIGQQYPWLKVHAVCADLSQDHKLLDEFPSGRRVVFYPGSTIGNLDPSAAVAFLTTMQRWVGNEGGIVVGVDLHKDKACLEAAYNDEQGVTAAFNLNVLERLNTIMDADFATNQFAHQAHYDEGKKRIEMHLISLETQQVRCDGSIIHFNKGESIHTENSYKYTLDGFANIASQAGLKVVHTWLDTESLFSVHYLSAE